MQGGEIVWLASYPKSGNTWVRMLLGNLLNLKERDDEEEGFNSADGISSSRQMFERYLGINTYDLTQDEIDLMRPEVYRCLADSKNTTHFLKTHDAFGRLPDGRAFFDAGRTRGALYMVRDPMDVAVSYSHFRGSTDMAATIDKMGDINDTLGGIQKEQLPQHVGDWSGHYRSWTGQSDIPVLTIRYEDLKANAVSELKRIVTFLRLDEADFAMSINDAVEAARFERLQSLEDKIGFAEKPDTAERFFRSGQIGEGRQKLPIELQERLITQHGGAMRELGYL